MVHGSTLLWQRTDPQNIRFTNLLWQLTYNYYPLQATKWPSDWYFKLGFSNCCCIWIITIFYVLFKRLFFNILKALIKCTFLGVFPPRRFETSPYAQVHNFHWSAMPKFMLQLCFPVFFVALLASIFSRIFQRLFI